MDVTLHEASPADLAVVTNLVPYYIYDLSEHLGWPCTPDGRFEGCDDLESYWRGPGRHAFVLRAGEEPAGFVLILAEHDEPDVDFSVTDFFVLRKFRGRGVGGAHRPRTVRALSWPLEGGAVRGPQTGGGVLAERDWPLLRWR